MERQKEITHELYRKYTLVTKIKGICILEKKLHSNSNILFFFRTNKIFYQALPRNQLATLVGKTRVQSLPNDLRVCWRIYNN